MKLRLACVVTAFLSLVLSLSAQTTAQAPPPLIQFSNVATDEGGNTLSGVIDIAFSLYNAQQGGESLWSETHHNVQLDPTGHYSVQLGITKPNGVPTALFTTGEARWLGVQIAQQPEQARLLLVSVPYALKAGDAATIGGLPPSAFVLAPTAEGSTTATGSAASAAGSAPPPAADVTTTGGKVRYLPIFNGASTIVDSVVYQSIIGAAAKVGIGTTTPAATLDVNGAVNAATSFNLGGNTFAYGSFAQTNVFLGFAGNSTMTGDGNTASGYQALLSNTSGYSNTASGWGTLQKNTMGCCNTASGNEALQNNATGNVNTATGNEALELNTTGSSNTASGSGALFFNAGGNFNTASGAEALSANTGGYANTANGWEALFLNSGGNNNTAIGAEALLNLTGGSNDTALGASAGPDAGFPSVSNSTAIGANADVTISNALVLGSINGVNGATASVNVGIGTTAPKSLLTVTGSDSTANGFGAALQISNAASGGGNWYLRSGATGNSTPAGGLSIANDDQYAVEIEANGNVGILTNTANPPDMPLTVNGGADKPGGGSWATFSDRRLKNLDGSFRSGLSQIMKLSPILYRYKADNAMGIRDREEHVGLVAQDVQKVVPEAVTENSKGYLLVNNDPIIWSMLNAIKEQQREIRALKSELRATRQTLQKVEVRVAGTQPALVAAKQTR